MTHPGQALASIERVRLRTRARAFPMVLPVIFGALLLIQFLLVLLLPRRVDWVSYWLAGGAFALGIGVWSQRRAYRRFGTPLPGAAAWSLPTAMLLGALLASLLGYYYRLPFLALVGPSIVIAVGYAVVGRMLRSGVVLAVGVATVAASASAYLLGWPQILPAVLAAGLFAEWVVLAQVRRR